MEVVEIFFRHRIWLRVISPPFLRQTQEFPIAWSRKRGIEMREREPLARPPIFDVVNFEFCCLVKHEHAIHKANHSIVAVAEASGDFRNRKAATSFIAIPVCREATLRDCVPFMWSVDVLEADVLSRLVRARNCVDGDFLQRLHIFWADVWY